MEGFVRIRRDNRYLQDRDDQSKRVSFHDFQDTKRICPVRDYSRTGVCFALEDGSITFRIGDVIPDLCFLFFDKEVHKSPATIIHIEDIQEQDRVISIIGCNFTRCMDIASIQKEDKVSRLRYEFQDFIQFMAIDEDLNPQFVHLTADLYYVLSSFQEWMLEEEKKINNEDIEMRQTLIEILKVLSFRAMKEVLEKYDDDLSRTIDSFNQSEEYCLYRESFQKRLNGFFMKSKLFARAYKKPLGYAGDFEMMNIIYRNDFEGSDVFSNVMNKIDCESPAAKAVRNSRLYIFNRCIKTIRPFNPQETFKIVSIACGPSTEMYDLLAYMIRENMSNRIEFIAMDQDRLALDDSRQRLDPLADKYSNISVKYEKDNFKRMIFGKEDENAIYFNAHLVYTTGLFDYLSANACNRLIQELYRFLVPGGTLVIGNIGMFNPQKIKMEYGAESFLIHRSENDLKDLAKGIPEDADIFVEKEQEGIFLFLNIRKPIS